jgi:hypothetical protein
MASLQRLPRSSRFDGHFKSDNEMSDCDEARLDEIVVAAPSAPAKKHKKRKHVSMAAAAKKTTTAMKKAPTAKKKQTSKPKSKSKDNAPRVGSQKSPAASYLLTGEVPSATRNPWDDTTCIQWTQEALCSVKNIFKQDMLFGSIKGTAAAVADFATDVMTCKKWIRFGNGRTASSNGENSLASILDYQEEFPSLEPIFRVINRFQVKSLMASPPVSWIYGNGSVTSPGVTNTHGKHRDRRHRIETFVNGTFGVETKRVRVAVSFTPPTGVHEGRVKETRYAY